MARGNAEGGETAKATGDRARLQAVSDQLTRHMSALVAAAKVRVAGGRVLLMSTVSSAYVGVWPDDTLYPLMADPSLVKHDELAGQLALLTRSIVDLPYVPDRVEPDGLPIFSPGGPNSAALTDRMPLHLPAAWVRLLDYYQGFDVEISRKEERARVIARSFNQIPFSYGLAYADPQRPTIGFGFRDTIKITGLELMSSLMLYRGLQRAVTAGPGCPPHHSAPTIGSHKSSSHKSSSHKSSGHKSSSHKSSSHKSIGDRRIETPHVFV